MWNTSIEKWFGPWNGLKLLHAVSWKSVKYILGSLNVLEIAYPGLWKATHKISPNVTFPWMTIHIHVIIFFYVGPGISFNYLTLVPVPSSKLDTRIYSLDDPHGPWNFLQIGAHGPWVSSSFCSWALSFFQLQLSDTEFPPINARGHWGFHQLLLMSPEFPVVHEFHTVTDRGPCSYCSLTLSFLQSLLQDPEFPPLLMSLQLQVIGTELPQNYCSCVLNFLQLLLLGPEFSPVTAPRPWISSSYYS
jgi:hypothetical protein